MIRISKTRPKKKSPMRKNLKRKTQKMIQQRPTLQLIRSRKTRLKPIKLKTLLPLSVKLNPKEGRSKKKDRIKNLKKGKNKIKTERNKTKKEWKASMMSLKKRTRLRARIKRYCFKILAARTLSWATYRKNSKPEKSEYQQLLPIIIIKWCMTYKFLTAIATIWLTMSRNHWLKPSTRPKLV